MKVMNVSIYETEKLRKCGFEFKHFEKRFDKGMVFWYDNQEWIVGGRVLSDNLDIPECVIKNGIWLPSLEHLLLWLDYNSFEYRIIYKSGEICTVTAKDNVNGEQYIASTIDFMSALTKIICKIYKSKKRKYDSSEVKLYEIIDEE